MIFPSQRPVPLEAPNKREARPIGGEEPEWLGDVRFEVLRSGPFLDEEKWSFSRWFLFKSFWSSPCLFLDAFRITCLFVFVFFLDLCQFSECFWSSLAAKADSFPKQFTVRVLGSILSMSALFRISFLTQLGLLCPSFSFSYLFKAGMLMTAFVGPLWSQFFTFWRLAGFVMPVVFAFRCSQTLYMCLICWVMLFALFGSLWSLCSQFCTCAVPGRDVRSFWMCASSMLYIQCFTCVSNVGSDVRPFPNSVPSILCFGFPCLTAVCYTRAFAYVWDLPFICFHRLVCPPRLPSSPFKCLPERLPSFPFHLFHFVSKRRFLCPTSAPVSRHVVSFPACLLSFSFICVEALVALSSSCGLISFHSFHESLWVG